MEAKARGIEIIHTGAFQHNEMSDRGPEHVKNSIQEIIHRFLDEDESPPKPNDESGEPVDPGLMALSAPLN